MLGQTPGDFMWMEASEYLAFPSRGGDPNLQALLLPDSSHELLSAHPSFHYVPKGLGYLTQKVPEL